MNSASTYALFTVVTRFLQVLGLCMCLSLLVSCGTSSSSSSSNSVGDITGVFKGSFSENGVSAEVIVYVANNRIMIARTDAQALYYGSYSGIGNYNATVIGYYDGTTSLPFVDAQLSFSYDGNTIKGTANNTYRESNLTSQSSISITKASNLSYLPNTYSASISGVNVSMSIDNVGNIQGVDSSGCSVSGSLSEIAQITGVFYLQSITHGATCTNFPNTTFSGFVIAKSDSLGNNIEVPLIYFNDSFASGLTLDKT